MNVKDQLIREEGKRRSAYQDTLGYWTIGVGRLIDERKGGGLSDAEIDLLLTNDIAAKTAELEAALPWFGRLSEQRQAVLIQMAFQMGTAGLLKFTETVGAIRDERWAHAAACMQDSLWAKQTPERAKRLARQIETGDWQ